jgi:hypothetical protein
MTRKWDKPFGWNDISENTETDSTEYDRRMLRPSKTLDKKD